MGLESALLDALRTLSPSSILLVGVIIFLWRELSREREARIAAVTTTMELGHRMVTSIDKLTEALNRKP